MKRLFTFHIYLLIGAIVALATLTAFATGAMYEDLDTGYLEFTKSLRVAGTGSFVGIQVSGGAGNGKVLTSDASGNATWQTVASGTPSGTAGQTLFYSGTSLIATSNFLRLSNGDYSVNGVRVGIGGGSVGSNTAIGVNALNANTTGASNTAVGNGAGSSLTSGDNNIFIGANTQPNISTTGSNQLNIGNWIYGNGGDVGIGTVSPAYKLDVTGSARVSSILYSPTIKHPSSGDICIGNTCP